MSALEGYDGHVWSAGGTSNSCSFKEWALDGGLTRESDTTEIGASELSPEPLLTISSSHK